MLRKDLFEAILLKEAPKESQRKRKSYKIELTDAQIWELKRDFDAFESARSGPIKVEELEVAMKHLGLEPKEEELRVIVVNQDPSGTVHLNDFLHAASWEMKKEITMEELKKVFQVFDDDNTGTISVRNLQRVAKELGQNISFEELKEMVEETDLDGDGEINWEEFQQIMREPERHPTC
ncbi:centrin-1-like isoform 1-T1 [Fundulus diaphanus]